MTPESEMQRQENIEPFRDAQIIFNPERYTRIVQLPYCCVPAALHAILIRRGLEPLSQETIGWDLGLVVPDSIAQHFSSVRTGTPGPAGYGTRIDLPEFSVPAFLTRHNLPLEFQYLSPNQTGSVEATLIDNIRCDNDIIACFDVGELYNRPDICGIGHVSVVDSINNGIISLVESARHKEPLQRVRAEDLTRAIQIHGESKMGGLWIISSLK